MLQNHVKKTFENNDVQTKSIQCTGVLVRVNWLKHVTWFCYINIIRCNKKDKTTKEENNWLKCSYFSLSNNTSEVYLSKHY